MKLMETSDPWNELMKESLYEYLLTIGKQSRERDLWQVEIMVHW